MIKLRRGMRDVDTAGRVDEAGFGLIMAGASPREVVTALAAPTRRSIRFLEPEMARPMLLAVDSGFDEADDLGRGKAQSKL